MKYFSLIITLLAASFANAQGDLVSINYGVAMRIPNHRITVVIDDSGHLISTTQSMNEDQKITKRRLTEDELSQLKKQLALVDWEKARKDKIIGLDGSSVRISYGGMKISLWTPQYDSRKRGIKKLQTAIIQIFKLAGLNNNGMPLKTADKPTK